MKTNSQRQTEGLKHVQKGKAIKFIESKKEQWIHQSKMADEPTKSLVSKILSRSDNHQFTNELRHRAEATGCDFDFDLEGAMVFFQPVT